MLQKLEEGASIDPEILCVSSVKSGAEGLGFGFRVRGFFVQGLGSGVYDPGRSVQEFIFWGPKALLELHHLLATIRRYFLQAV